MPQQELVQTPRRRRCAPRERIGFPVVTKPYNGNHGRGISIRLTTDEEVRARLRSGARALALGDRRELSWRATIIACWSSTASWSPRRGARPATSSAMASTPSRELIDIVNQDPRRGVGHEKVLTRLELDAQAQKMLERAGLNADSVPPRGQIVYLRSTANLSTGGTATDVTDVIHPDNREMAERAVRAIGLDVGGVDFLLQGHHRELPRRSAAASAR